jgi:hypothetical protein
MRYVLVLLAVLQAPLRGEVTVTATPLFPVPVKKYLKKSQFIKAIENKIPTPEETLPPAIKDPFASRALLSITPTSTHKPQGKLEKKKASPGGSASRKFKAKRSKRRPRI